MKSTNNLIFAMLTTLVPAILHTSPIRADNSAPVRLTFEKTLAGTGPAPYLFHFTGTFGGDFSGELWVGTVAREVISESVSYTVADYLFTADDGIHSFTARVEGIANHQTNKAVLNGTITAGWLEGAQVQDEFDILGGGHFAGTFRIMPASAN
jgi:hypothetical protein